MVGGATPSSSTARCGRVWSWPRWRAATSWATPRRRWAGGSRDRGAARGIVDFHRILRTLELRNAGRTEAYGKLFERVPMVGFSTYGEAWVGHINQTSTMLVFR